MLAYKAHNLVIRVGFPTALPISGGVSERSIVAVLKPAEASSPPWVRIPPPPPISAPIPARIMTRLGNSVCATALGAYLRESSSVG